METTILFVLFVALSHATLRLDSWPSWKSYLPVAAAVGLAFNIQIRSAGLGDPPYPALSDVRAYVSNLRAGLANLDQSTTIILTSPVPEMIVPKTYSPYNEMVVFLRLFPQPFQIGDATTATHRVRDDGTIEPIPPAGR